MLKRWLNMSEPLLRAEELAQMFKVNLSTVYEWARMDFIPSIRLGACVRFERPAVEKWLAAKRKEGRTRRVPDA